MNTTITKNWLNWLSENSGNLIDTWDQAFNCSNWGVYITKTGISTFKDSQSNSESKVAPLEHYHTILIDEKYQTYEFTETPYTQIRKQLIDMLFEIGKKLRQTTSTVFLSIKYMDIILSTVNYISQTVPPSSYKLISLVCLNIASKFDALDLNTPLIHELQRASGCSIPYSALVQYEAECLKLLNWNLKHITLFHWIDVLKHQGIIFSNDTKWGGTSIDVDLTQSVSKAPILLDYFTDMLVRDSEFLKFKPSIQAAACVIATRMCLNIDQPISNALSEMLLYSQEDIVDAFELLNKNYGYLIDAAESTLTNIESSNYGNRLEKLTNNSIWNIQQEQLTKTFEKLSNIHDYTDKIVSRIRTWHSVCSEEESSIQSEENQQLSTESEDGGYFYYEDNGIQIPYNLDEVDLSYIEQSIQHQMQYGQHPLAQIRSASTASDLENYKAQISSLLGGKTKGSTSGKENYEDLNNDESPLFDAEMLAYYDNEKLSYMLSKTEGLGKLALEHHNSNCQNESDNIKVEEDKLAKKREKRKEKKKRRKMRKQAMKNKAEEETEEIAHIKLQPAEVA